MAYEQTLKNEGSMEKFDGLSKKSQLLLSRDQHRFHSKKVGILYGITASPL